MLINHNEKFKLMTDLFIIYIHTLHKSTNCLCVYLQYNDKFYILCATNLIKYYFIYRVIKSEFIFCNI